MTIQVQFPAGIQGDVPSICREIKSQEIDGTGLSMFVDEPAFDPDWRFSPAVGEKWFAFPRR